MKTLVVRNLLWLIPLLTQLPVLAQQATPAITETPAKKVKKEKKKGTFSIDIEAGATMPMGPDVSEVYKAGATASIGFKKALLKSGNLWIRPVGGLKFYSKKSSLEGNDVQEVVRDWKAGLEIQYKVATVNKFSFYPIIRIDNNWVSNRFSKLTTDESTNTRLLLESDNVLSGTGVSFDAGLVVMRLKEFYVKIDYEYFKPDLKVNPDLVKELLAEGILMPDHKAYDFSTASISVGINLNFKK